MSNKKKPWKEGRIWFLELPHYDIKNDIKNEALKETRKKEWRKTIPEEFQPLSLLDKDL